MRGTPDAVETGEWGPADYVGEDGETIPLHYKLYVYPQSLIPRCKDWSLSDQFPRIARLAAECRDRGIHLTVVLPPMADNVLTQVCQPYGIDTAMEQEVLPQLKVWAGAYDFTLLDYEWENRPDFDDDTQFYEDSTWTRSTACPSGWTSSSPSWPEAGTRTQPTSARWEAFFWHWIF